MARLVDVANTLAAIGASLLLSGCADDGYHDRGYTSMSFGVSSGGGDGHHRGYRDRDGDGVPNRYDDHPNNPYRP